MTRAVEILEAIKEINESYLEEVVDYEKVEVKEEGEMLVVKMPVKGIMGTQDARRLMTHIAGMGYDAGMSVDNLAVIIKIAKADAAKAKEELGIDV